MDDIAIELRKYARGELTSRAVRDATGTTSIIERAEIITTGSFLSALERAGLVQSADYILDQAANAGRHVEGQRGERFDDRVRDWVNDLWRHGGQTNS